MRDAAFSWAGLGRAVGPCLRPGGLTLTARALQVCRLPAGARVADIGCGTGGTLQYLEENGSYRLVGFDPAPAALGEAASRLAAAQLVGSRAENLPCRNGSFDALFCECVLSLLAAPATALDEFARVLKEEGLLVVSDLFRKNSPGGAGSPEGLFSREEILALLARRGFRLLLWEEHDRLLREFVARLILAGEELPGLGGCARRQQGTAPLRPAVGYFLLLARKSTSAG